MMKSIIVLVLLFVTGKYSLQLNYQHYVKTISTFSEEEEKNFDIKIVNKDTTCEHKEFLNLDQMNLKMIKNDIILSNAIRSVSLHNNFLKKIPHGILDYVTHLSCMNLSRNSINLYETNQILHPNLQVLDLSYQTISDVNSIPEVEILEETENTYKYKYLIFNSSKIKLPNLEYLNLRGNEISSLLWDFNLSFPKLVRLDLNNINADELEPNFFDKISTSLRVLHLENNNLRNLTLQNVAEITSLYLDGNIFETLYINSTKLKKLSLSNCTKHLNKGFFYVPYLEQLDLSRNNFGNEFDVRFEEFRSLRVLLLDYNKLLYVPPLANLQLNELSLRYNIIRYIKPNSFKHLTSLTKLSLKGNKIERLEKETFSNLENLEYLDLSENQLNHLSTDWSSPLMKLQYLNVNSNQFASIGEMGLYSINSLQHLFIKNNTFNKITTIEIEPLPGFVTVYLI